MEKRIVDKKTAGDKGRRRIRGLQKTAEDQKEENGGRTRTKDNDGGLPIIF